MSSKTITTTYEGPDLDGYGCAVAYAELLNKQGVSAEAHIWGVPHLEVQWLLETFNLPRASGPTDNTSARVVLLDASSPENLPKPLALEQVVEIIDHRKIHKADEFINAKHQIELIGAAATLVAERFKLAELVPSKESALFLLGGILSNTQNFTAIATERDREMAAWLTQISGASENLAQQMFLAKSDLSGSRLRESLVGDLKTLNLNGTLVTIAQLEIIGVAKLLSERRDEIKNILFEIQAMEKAPYTFLNMKDLDSGISTILCLDQRTADLLDGLPDAKWSELLIESPTLTLRKTLSAWLLEKLQRS